eukprot:jgi/Bigna1/141163/aug1.60_g15871
MCLSYFSRHEKQDTNAQAVLLTITAAAAAAAATRFSTKAIVFDINLLQRLLARNRNQHRGAVYYRRLQRVHKVLEQLRKDTVLCFKEDKSLENSEGEGYVSTLCEMGSMVSEAVKQIKNSSSLVISLLANTFFMAFALTIFSLLANIHEALVPVLKLLSKEFLNLSPHQIPEKYRDENPEWLLRRSSMSHNDRAKLPGTSAAASSPAIGTSSASTIAAVTTSEEARQYQKQQQPFALLALPDSESDHSDDDDDGKDDGVEGKENSSVHKEENNDTAMMMKKKGTGRSQIDQPGNAAATEEDGGADGDDDDDGFIPLTLPPSPPARCRVTTGNPRLPKKAKRGRDEERSKNEEREAKTVILKDFSGPSRPQEFDVAGDSDDDEDAEGGRGGVDFVDDTKNRVVGSISERGSTARGEKQTSTAEKQKHQQQATTGTLKMEGGKDRRGSSQNNTGRSDTRIDNDAERIRRSSSKSSSGGGGGTGKKRKQPPPSGNGVSHKTDGKKKKYSTMTTAAMEKQKKNKKKVRMEKRQSVVTTLPTSATRLPPSRQEGILPVMKASSLCTTTTTTGEPTVPGKIEGTPQDDDTASGRTKKRKNKKKKKRKSAAASAASPPPLSHEKIKAALGGPNLKIKKRKTKKKKMTNIGYGGCSTGNTNTEMGTSSRDKTPETEIEKDMMAKGRKKMKKKHHKKKKKSGANKMKSSGKASSSATTEIDDIFSLFGNE